jgi:CRP-like cAMP-binding protein
MSATLENLLLNSLSSESRDFFISRSTAVELPLRTPLYEAERSPKFAYFLTSGIASVVMTMLEGGTAEVVVIGNEGIVGSTHILGAAPVQTRCFMQLKGSALRVPLAVLRDAFRSSEEIRDRVLEFVQHQSLCISQIAGCNRLHGAEERLARWLLMVQDRIDSDTLNLTQEFLAEMLGAQRTTVTLVAGILQESGLIEYRRGHVKIVHRERLEHVACDCYQVTKRLYHGLYRGSREAKRASSDGRKPSSQL